MSGFARKYSARVTHPHFFQDDNGSFSYLHSSSSSLSGRSSICSLDSCCRQLATPSVNCLAIDPLCFEALFVDEIIFIGACASIELPWLRRSRVLHTDRSTLSSILTELIQQHPVKQLLASSSLSDEQSIFKAPLYIHSSKLCGDATGSG